MNFTIYLVLWSILALFVVGLALYRKMIAVHQGDDLMHLAASEQSLIPSQVAVARKLNRIDHCGEALTAITLFAGLLLAAARLYAGWESSQILK